MKNQQNLIFPNELNNRNQVAIPGKVWCMDLSTLKTKITTAKDYNVKLFIVMDLAARNIILHKLFKVKGQGSIKAKYITRALELLLEKKNDATEQELIIHSDRGAEFTSQEYHKLFRNKPFLIGSMSKTNMPTDNAVVERAFRTLKTQLLQHQLPKEVKSLYQMELLVAKKIDFYNKEVITMQSLGLTKNELAIKLAESKEQTPEVILHWNNKDAMHKEIENFKLASLRESLIQDIQVTRKNTDEIKQSQIETRTELKSLIYDLKDDLAEVNKKLEHKSKRIRRKHLPLRQPASNTIYEFLLKLKRPKRAEFFVWARNRLAITFLFYLGLRANEVTQITKKMIEDGINHGQIQIKQTKTGYFKIILFTQALKDKLKKEHFIDIQTVFKRDNHILGWSQRKGKPLNEQVWLDTLNEFMQPARDTFGLKLTSHSFRINFVTSLLRLVPIQQVQVIVGHKNITTTQQYDRYKVEPQETVALIDKALHQNTSPIESNN